MRNTKAFYSDPFRFPLPEGHRFPLEKYTLLRQRLLAEGVLDRGDLAIPAPASDDQLYLVHDTSYVARVVQGRLSAKEIRRIGLPWSPELVERSRRSVGGTIAACREALRQGAAANLAGGTHHVHPSFGSGFCVFNDAAVAARIMQQEAAASRIVLIDCDVHQGDGSAAIFQGDPSVYTFSIHGEGNFPFHKEESDLDVALADGSGDAEYLSALELALERALSEASADLAVYLAGADPYKGDRFGRLSLTKSGLAARDEIVLRRCFEDELPVAVVMAGGYAREIGDVVAIHTQTMRTLVALSASGTPG